MLMNPITTAIGVIVALCPIIGAFVPEVKAVCDMLMGQAIGAGFIAAKDGIKLPMVQPATIKSVLFWIGLSIFSLTTISACSQFKDMFADKTKIESVFAATVAGFYSVLVTKDGVVLYTETWQCTSDGTKLTGCHRLLQPTGGTPQGPAPAPTPGLPTPP